MDSDYASLMFFTRLLPTWGFVSETKLKAFLVHFHTLIHPESADTRVEWALTTGGILVSSCGVEVSLSKAMRQMGAERN